MRFKDVEESKALCTVVGCTLVQPLWKTIGRFLKILKMEIPYDSAFPGG